MSLCIVLFMNRTCLESDIGITILVLMVIEVISIAIILVYVLLVFLKKSREVRHTKADRDKIIGKLKAKYEGEVMPCSICLADIAQEEEIIKLKCSEKHVFHENCIKSWMDVKICCPVCRKNIN